MGGDHGLAVTIPAALRAIDKHPELTLLLVGNQEVVMGVLREHQADVGERLKIHHASQQVEMDELPSQALRGKKDSSMRVAINLVKEGAAQACVSAGNTGALMATGRYVLKTLEGIDRPAILKLLPTMRGHTHMLDLGANVDTPAKHLVQFAVMGAALTEAVDNKVNPTVGLLNIGGEEMKGNEQVKKAALLLEKCNLNYVGFVEGNDIYSGNVDVVVCDGFVGNVALKTSEGLAKMIAQFMKEEFNRTILSRLAGLAAVPVLNGLKDRIDPRRYNGASLVGLQGTVIKSHGSADVIAFANAIDEAVLEVKQSVPQRISSKIETLLKIEKGAQADVL